MNDGAPERAGNAIVRLGSFWHIASEPQVMMRLKRLWAGIAKDVRGEIRMKRSPEVDREVQWVLDGPWDFTISEEDRADLHRGAEAMRAQVKQIESILGGAVPDREWPIAVTLRDYQKVGAAWWNTARRCLLADEAGVGKTLTSLAGLSAPGTLPAVIVCDLDLMIQWRGQVLRAYPDARVHIIRSSGEVYDVIARTKQEEKRAGLPVGNGWPDFVICNYHKLAKWAPVFSRAGVQSLIYDEVQRVRHHDNDRYAGVMLLAASVPRIMGLSATPIHNYGEEFFNITEAIRPGMLGTREEFKREWCHRAADGKATLVDARAFGNRLRESGFMLRRTKKEVGRDLGKCTIVPYLIDADLSILSTESHELRRLATIIADPPKGAGAFQVIGRAQREFDAKLRQLTGITKAPHVAALAEMVIDSGKSVIILGWHRGVWDILAKRLERFAPAFRTGEETVKQKEEAFRRFTAGETPVMCISIESAAGMDGLQHVCSTGITAEFSWTPVPELQGRWRIDRDGQEEPVTWYRPYIEWGSDPIVMDVCTKKMADSAGVLDPNEQAAPHQVDPNLIKKLAIDYLQRHR